MGFVKKLLLPVLLFLLLLPFATQARSSFDYAVTQSITIAELPTEARTTRQLIKQGGPFPYSRDGLVFGNREKLLPKKQRDYYHEYTVKTPGARNRGARRIVCGLPPDCYYTDDHYQTFKLIRE